MSKNTNCLEGLRCPACGNEDKLLVWATVCMAVTDDGTDFYDDEIKDRDADYCDEDPAECPACGRRGALWSFRTGHSP